MAGNYALFVDLWESLDNWIVHSGSEQLSVSAGTCLWNAGATPAHLAWAGSNTQGRLHNTNYVAMKYTVTFNVSGSGLTFFRVPVFSGEYTYNNDMSPVLVYDGTSIQVGGLHGDFGSLNGSKITGNTCEIRVVKTFSGIRFVAVHDATTLDSGFVSTSTLFEYNGEPKQKNVFDSTTNLSVGCISIWKEGSVTGNVVVGQVTAYIDMDDSEITSFISGSSFTTPTCPDPVLTLSGNDLAAGSKVVVTASVPGYPTAYIRITTDGTTPISSHTTQTLTPGESVVISRTSTLKAIATFPWGSLSPNGRYGLPSAVVAVDIRIGSQPEGTFVKPIIINPAMDSWNIGSKFFCSLVTDTPDTEIRYTVDGSAPSISSQLYTEPFAITATTTVRAVAYKAGLTPSEPAIKTYRIGNAVVSDNFSDLSNWIVSSNASVSGNVMTVTDPTGLGVVLKRELCANNMAFSFTVTGPFKLKFRNSQLAVAWMPDVNDSNTYKFGIWRGTSFVQGGALSSGYGTLSVRICLRRHLNALPTMLIARSSSGITISEFEAVEGFISNTDTELEFTNEELPSFGVSSFSAFLNLNSTSSYGSSFLAGANALTNPPSITPSGLVTLGSTISVTSPGSLRVQTYGQGSTFETVQTSPHTITVNNNAINIRAYAIESGKLPSDHVEGYYRVNSESVPNHIGYSKFALTPGGSQTPNTARDTFEGIFGRHGFEKYAYVTSNDHAYNYGRHRIEYVHDELKWVGAEFSSSDASVSEYLFTLNNTSAAYVLGFTFGDDTVFGAVKVERAISSRVSGRASLVAGVFNATLETFVSTRPTKLVSQTIRVRVARRFISSQMQVRFLVLDNNPSGTVSLRHVVYDTGWFNVANASNSNPSIRVLSKHGYMEKAPIKVTFTRCNFWTGLSDSDAEAMLVYRALLPLPLPVVTSDKPLVGLEYGEAVQVTITPSASSKLPLRYVVGDVDPAVYNQNVSGAYINAGSTYTNGSPQVINLNAPFKLALRALPDNTALDGDAHDPYSLQVIEAKVDTSEIVNVASAIAGEVTLYIDRAKLSIFSELFFEFEDGYRTEQSTTYSPYSYTVLKRKLSAGIHKVRVVQWGAADTNVYWLKRATEWLEFTVPAKLQASFVNTTNIIPGDSVSFDSTLVGGTSGFTYLWDFGDGSTSTQADPTHVYTTPGIYSVTLRVQDSNGDSSVVEKYNAVTVIQPTLQNSRLVLNKTVKVS